MTVSAYLVPKHCLLANYPHTKIELCPLQLALVGVITRLVLGGCRSRVGNGLLQKRVGAHRGRARRLVEEGDDILLGGLEKYFGQ